MEDWQPQSRELANETASIWQEGLNFLFKFGTPKFQSASNSTKIPGINLTIGELSTKLMSVLGLVEGVTQADDILLVPESWRRQLYSELQNLRASSEAVMGYVAGTETDRINNYELENLRVTLTDGSVHKIGNLLANVNVSLESVLVAVQTISPVINFKEFGPYATGMRNLVATQQETQQIRSDVLASFEAIKTMETRIYEIGEDSETQLTNVSDAAQSSLLSRKTAEEAAADSDLTLTRITSVDKQAEELKARIVAYRADLERFQSDIDEKEKQFDSLKNNFENSHAKLTVAIESVEQLANDAESMLTGSTKAGLARTYKKMLDELDPKVEVAETKFNNSIRYLFLASLPLVIYLLLSGASNILGDKIILLRGIEISTLRVLALALPLLPMIWSAKFSASKHHDLFTLREDYAHRYSLCMAVDGFQKQAPEFTQEIAGATFLEMSKNPVSTIGTKKETVEHPNKLQSILMDKFGLNYKGKEDSA
ncbi:MAG: hypothetical protein GKS03_04660 [Alphaproteobacteria bacterium]|nr:hypothetical protein [Alphaproteobacteria bacterium]